MSEKTFSKDFTSKRHLLSCCGEKRRCSFPFFRDVELLLYSNKRRPHAGLRMHVTFFVSLWKREKCANQFLVVARRERLRKDEGRIEAGEARDTKVNSRAIRESSCTCVILIRCVYTFTMKACDYFG